MPRKAKTPEERAASRMPPDPVEQHILDRLKLARAMRGVKQEELAGLLGIHRTQLQKHEDGLDRISAGRLYRVAALLEVPISYYFEGIPASAIDFSRPPPRETVVKFDEILNIKTAELVRRFAASPAGVQEGIMSILRTSSLKPRKFGQIGSAPKDGE